MSNLNASPKMTLSRRHALKGATLAAGFSLAPTKIFADEERVPPTRRMAVIGGGMGGVASAYFADGSWKVDLFEARDRIGGNASSLRIEVNGKEHSLDLGAQFFHPDTHPLYWSLLQHIGALNLDKTGEDLVIELPSTLSIFNAAEKKSLFSSTQPFENLMGAIAFSNFTKLAREAVDTISWDMTVEEWLASITLDENFKKDILLPWLTSLTTGVIATTKLYSARSLLNFFAKTFPEVMLAPPSTYNSSIGLEGYLQLMIGQCKDVTVHLKSPVLDVEKVGEAWFVTTESGRQGPYEAVIVNAHPIISKKFLKNVSPDLFGILDRYETFDARIVLHHDPAYILPDRKYWGSLNTAVGPELCEASVWVGSGQPEGIDVFKSWALHRSEEPVSPIADRFYQHTYSGAQTLQATRDLRAFENPKGLYFAGAFTEGFDLQETALFSALKVVRQIAADSSRLTSFEERLAKDGKSQLKHDFN